MLMMLMRQGAVEAARERYWAGARFIWVLLVILLIAAIVLVIKKIMR